MKLNHEVKEQTMNNSNKLKQITTVGIDLAKNSFQIHASDPLGNKLMNKKMSRPKLKEFIAQLKPCLIAMEACGSAHYWARLFQSFGHHVKLIAPQFVKPFVKSNKNDAADAEAICEAVQRPTMRFVAIKTIEQQDIQAIHRIRSLQVSRRTAQINQIRGLLLEYGIEISKGRKNVTKCLPDILEDADNKLSGIFRAELHLLQEILRQVDDSIDDCDHRINLLANNNEQAKRLQSIPGIGPLTATALVASIGDIKAFKNGRELAAWIGLVPRQHSTGGKNTLLGISKRGDVYLRQLLIHGARSVLIWVDKKSDKTSRWAQQLKAKRHANIAAVAMANKMARTVFSLLKNETNYQVDFA